MNNPFDKEYTIIENIGQGEYTEVYKVYKN